MPFIKLTPSNQQALADTLCMSRPELHLDSVLAGIATAARYYDMQYAVSSDNRPEVDIETALDRMIGKYAVRLNSIANSGKPFPEKLKILGKVMFKLGVLAETALRVRITSVSFKKDYSETEAPTPTQPEAPRHIHSWAETKDDSGYRCKCGAVVDADFQPIAQYT